MTFIPVALSLRWGWKKGYRMFWMTPLVWVGGEYLRILGPIGFPFGSLALPVYEQIWLIQLADLGGIHLVSGVVAMISGLLLDLARLLTIEKARDWSRYRGSLLWGGSILTMALIYNQVRLKQIEQSLQQADDEFRSWVHQLGVPVLFGQVTRIPTDKNGAPIFEEFNAARLVRPELEDHLERQFKIRLFPGGEYLPGGRERFRTWLSASEYFSDWLDSISDIKSGKERGIFFLNHKSTDNNLSSAFSVSICSETSFPESAGVFTHTHQDKNLFHVSMANEGRFQRNHAQLVSYMNLPFRAIESRRSIARSANTGISGFTDPTGRLHGQVRNSRGQYRTGKGFPEEETIQAFQQKAKTMKPGKSYRKIQAQLSELTNQIRTLRSEAGVSGYSIAKVHYSHFKTLYQKIGDLFAQIALAGLITTTVCSFNHRRY